MKVIVAVDEPKVAEKIVEFVWEHSWPADTTFIVLHVIEELLVGSYMSVLPYPLLEEIKADMLKVGQKLVAEVATSMKSKLPKGTTVEEKIIEGHAKEAIVAFANEQKCNAIVMGSHGKHGLERLMLGSVSMAVAAHAPCSVMIVQTKNISKGAKKPTAEQSKSSDK